MLQAYNMLYLHFDLEVVVGCGTNDFMAKKKKKTITTITKNKPWLQSVWIFFFFVSNLIPH